MTDHWVYQGLLVRRSRSGSRKIRRVKKKLRFKYRYVKTKVNTSVLCNQLIMNVNVDMGDVSPRSLSGQVPLPSPIRLRLWLPHGSSARSNPQCVLWSSARG